MVDFDYDMIGELVGFFCFIEGIVCCFVMIVVGYVDSGCVNMLYEEVVCDLLFEGGYLFDVVDVIGLLWIEIDFLNDVVCVM